MKLNHFNIFTVENPLSSLTIDPIQAPSSSAKAAGSAKAPKTPKTDEKSASEHKEDVDTPVKRKKKEALIIDVC